MYFIDVNNLCSALVCFTENMVDCPVWKLLDEVPPIRKHRFQHNISGNVAWLLVSKLTMYFIRRFCNIWVGTTKLMQPLSFLFPLFFILFFLFFGIVLMQPPNQKVSAEDMIVATTPQDRRSRSMK